MILMMLWSQVLPCEWQCVSLSYDFLRMNPLPEKVYLVSKVHTSVDDLPLDREQRLKQLEFEVLDPSATFPRGKGFFVLIDGVEKQDAEVWVDRCVKNGIPVFATSHYGLTDKLAGWTSRKPRNHNVFLEVQVLKKLGYEIEALPFFNATHLVFKDHGRWVCLSPKHTGCFEYYP